MRRLLILLCLVGVTFNAQAVCSKTDRQQMISGGMEEARIEAFCTRNHKPISRKLTPPMTGKTCKADEMRCPLPTEGKLNDTCWCSSSIGVISGVVIR